MCDLRECESDQMDEITNGTDEQFNGIFEEIADIEESETSPRKAAERLAQWLWNHIFG